ncbi:beta-glucosidase H [Streptomyces sp. NPDC002740]
MNRFRGMTRRQLVTAAVLGTAGAMATGVPASAATRSAGDAPSAQPWRDPAASADRRADLLLAAMTHDEKVTLITAVEVADHLPLEYLGIPAMTRVDASDGLRGDKGVTAFPAPNALAATFDTELAQEYGRAIGAEARAKGWNVLLGPTVDIDRDPRNGREAESYGEDPLVNGLIGAAVTRGFQQNHVIAQVKHFTVYNQEDGRNSLDVRVSERALRELYYPAFEHAVRDGGALSVMGSYPKVNGVSACQNEHLITALKQDLGLKGYLGTDFQPSADPVEIIKAGVDSGALEPDVPEAAFSDGRIPVTRTNDAARRILYALFASGAFDHPLPATPAEVVTTPEHQALARVTGERATVLLKNAGRLLPLSKKKTVAVIGPAGKDAVTGVEGSSYVEPGDFTNAADAIRGKAGAGRVLVAQGSYGDVALPVVPAGVFATPDGEPGLHAEFFDNEAFEGDAVAVATTPGVDFRRGNPVTLPHPGKWSARWTGTITPPATGWVRFSALLSGAAKVTVDGTTVFDASRFVWDFFFAPQEYTVGGVTRLTAGRPVGITVEYSTKDAGFNGPSMKLCWQPDSLIPAAVAAARKADTAVVFVNNFTGEAVDRDSLALPGDQNQLIEAVAAVNPDTVVVLNTSGPVLMPWIGAVKGVVQGWYQGAATGTALANVLYGDAEPGGRLPVTFPAREDQGPVRYEGGKSDGANGVIAYDEGIYVGYKWFDKHRQKPLFPFGHGLSYTSFAYTRLRIDGIDLGDARDTARVRVEVRNTGRRTGSDVVQVYRGHLPTGTDTPERQLVGFARVSLEPGERRTVTIEIDRRALSYWDESRSRWVTPTGTVPVFVGRSVADIACAGAVKVE